MQLEPVLDALTLSSSEATMDSVRTYILETIAKAEEIRYS
jgi:hypothetical protein